MLLEELTAIIWRAEVGPIIASESAKLKGTGRDLRVAEGGVAIEEGIHRTTQENALRCEHGEDARDSGRLILLRVCARWDSKVSRLSKVPKCASLVRRIRFMMRSPSACR